MRRTKLFVNVILPLPLPRLYTYRVPDKLFDDIEIGKRVVVQFGKTKIYTALIESIHHEAPKGYKAKNILSVLDPQPVIHPPQLELWRWISSYYMCTLGEVMNAAIPSGLKLASETQLQPNPDFSGDSSILNTKEHQIVKALESRGTLSISQTVRVIGQKTIFPYIKSLIEKGVIIVHEELPQRYKPKYEICIKLCRKSDNEQALQVIFDQLGKAPKQLELLMTYISLSNKFTDNAIEVTRNDLLRNCGASPAILNQLINKQILKTYKKEIGRLNQNNEPGDVKTAKIEFSKNQKKVLKNIKAQFRKRDVVLLHGVTSSGKTEIYIDLIEETLKHGKQVLYLLPEIALTAQIINRLRKHFGNRVGVYHSKFNDSERVEIWNAVLKSTPQQVGGTLEDKQGLVFSDKTTGENIANNSTSVTYDIILGARSAVFLPFSNLGLAIIDEEHENTYKQTDPAPRYHGRDTLIYLAKLHGAKTLLGSATPSIESYYNTAKGLYGIVEIMERYGNVQMPEISIINLKEETRRKRMRSLFSHQLVEEINQSLSNIEQVILFQNRRGFSPFLQCELCAWTPHCKNCDVSLTYHKYFNLLKCHYCGYSRKIPGTCEACEDTNIQTKGFGTEKVEEELALLFPEAKIKRMDLDTTRSKYAYHQIISDFENKKIDILVGTQMVTKGLDFDNVSVVGILNADIMLNYPDFRSFERGFQLMAQVGGRAGRKKKRGKVIIQAYKPDHAIIKNVVNNDYRAMYEDELLERKNYRYPPYYRLVELSLKHKDYKLLDKGADALAAMLWKDFGRRVLGPVSPVVGRVRNQYIKTILLKLEKEASAGKAKSRLTEVINGFKLTQPYKPIKVLVDVDPM